jgi:hypothetical protein
VIDTASDSHPLDPVSLREQSLGLLASGRFLLDGASDGFLRLKRNPDPDQRATPLAMADDLPGGRFKSLETRAAQLLPAGFATFAQAGGALPPGAVALAPVRFGSIELVGYRASPWPEVGLFGPHVTVETYWRADEPVPADLRFLAISTGTSGAEQGDEIDPAPEPLWYPTSSWKPGELVRITLQFGSVHELQAGGIAVVNQEGARVPATAPAGAVLWDRNTAARVLEFSSFRHPLD